MTKPGDLWILGSHRLLCADACDAVSFARLLRGEQADACWTDPPYGVKYVGKTAEALTIENDELSGEDLEKLLRTTLGLALEHCRPGAAWYVAGPNNGDAGAAFVRVLHDLGVYRHQLVWLKDSFVMGRADYHYRHEPIFYGWKPGAARTWLSDRSQDSVLDFARPKASEEHPTMKPLGLVSYCLNNSCPEGGIVLDPFAGSGTTLLAAQATARSARCLELDPSYCDVVVERWQLMTGRKAELAAPVEPVPSE